MLLSRHLGQTVIRTVRAVLILRIIDHLPRTYRYCCSSSPTVARGCARSAWHISNPGNLSYCSLSVEVVQIMRLPHDNDSMRYSCIYEEVDHTRYTPGIYIFPGNIWIMKWESMISPRCGGRELCVWSEADAILYSCDVNTSTCTAVRASSPPTFNTRPPSVVSTAADWPLSVLVLISGGGGLGSGATSRGVKPRSPAPLSRRPIINTVVGPKSTQTTHFHALYLPKRCVNRFFCRSQIRG